MLARPVPTGRPHPAASGGAPAASVIIPVYNRADLTALCLGALARERPAVPHEILVVNDGSSDQTPVLLQRYRGACRVLHNAANRGFATACNQGATAARGQYLVFLNNDTLPHAGWLDELVRVAAAEPDVGAVGCKILSWDGTRLCHAGLVLRDAPPWPLFLHYLYRGAPPGFPAANKQRDFQAVTGACMLVPGELFRRIGGFDPQYRNGFEDVDLCFRIRTLGRRVIYTPRAVVRHFEHASPGRHDHDEANYARLCRGWAGRFPADIQRYLQEDGFTRDPFAPHG